MAETVSVVTHCDTFHCDEVVACAMLKYLYGSINIIRTRDADKIARLNAKGAIVVDVGKALDPENGCFDHHQSRCVDTYNEYWKIPLSSCGLVFKCYGTDIIIKKARELNVEFTDKQIATVKNKLYSLFIVSVDANDTGVPHIKKEYDIDTVCNYRSQITLCDVIARMNHKKVFEDEPQHSRFVDAVNVAQVVFDIYLNRSILDESEFATELVEFKTIFEAHRDYPEILVIEKTYKVRPFLRILDPKQVVKFIIAPRGRSGWQIWTVNKPGKRFDTLAPIVPENVAREVLECPDDLVFVHANKFIAGFKTQEAAMHIAKHSLCLYHAQPKWHLHPIPTKKNLTRSAILVGAVALGVILGVRLIRK